RPREHDPARTGSASNRLCLDTCGRVRGLVRAQRAQCCGRIGRSKPSQQTLEWALETGHPKPAVERRGVRVAPRETATGGFRESPCGCGGASFGHTRPWEPDM